MLTRRGVNPLAQPTAAMAIDHEAETRPNEDDELDLLDDDDDDDDEPDATDRPLTQVTSAGEPVPEPSADLEMG